MGSPYSDLDRGPLRAEPLRRALVQPESIWTEVEVLAEATSTNAVVASRAEAGAAEGLVVIAEHQSAGRGRLDRSWRSPARAGLTFSVLLRPSEVPVQHWSWLPLLAGLALAEGMDAVVELPPDRAMQLKWPNDLLISGRKVGGVLAERRGEQAVVIGAGINVTTRRAELPGEQATSLLMAGALVTDRDTVLRSCLRALDRRYRGWGSAAGEPAELAAAYRERCVTLGSEVSVALPDGGELAGTAVRIDAGGRLVVADPRGEHAVASGDVVHVRPMA